MHKLIVANYKMNGDKKFYIALQKKFNKLNLKDTNIVLCPPFVYLPFLKVKNKKVSFGSQDISNVQNTKSTGQISPAMLKEFGVEYCIIGHSERRAIGETNDLIAEKVETAVKNGIQPIICVGESKKNLKLDVLTEQVKSVLSKVKDFTPIFAYEPVWAIGSGEVPAVARINKAIELINNVCKECGYSAKILYGGSVGLNNYKELNTSKAEGFLLGGISLKVDEFITLVKGVDNE